MKKHGKFLYIAVIAMLVISALCLVACGTNGVDGTDGKNGIDGKSAYEIWLDNGHTGSQTDFLDWLKGKDGKDGTNGTNGKDGVDGTDGQDGQKGDKGDKGDAGEQGPQGEKGDKGDNGQDGENGTDGQDGKSAYQIWLDNGNSGTETDFLTWLKGQDGKNGTDGIDGEKGDKGDKGDSGEQGPQGEKGDKGDNGQDGTNGENGKSAFEIFMQYYPYYTGTEQDWINGLINGQLHVYTVTFKSEVSEDIVKHVFQGYSLTDIPEVPEKEGQASAEWDITDFTNVQQDITVNAVYVMQTRTVTFHNEFTDGEDIVKTVEYGQAITDIPTITAKQYNDAYWSVKDFGCIKENITVNAIYETQGLQYTPINQQTQYRVSKGEMNTKTNELFIPAEHDGKPVTVIDENAFNNSQLSFTFAYIPYGISEIRARAFSNCEELIDIRIPNSVTSIGDQVFFRCSSLTNITIPNSVTSIGSGVFTYCSKLTSVAIPNSLTSISSQMFSECSRLTSVIIPDSVMSIEFNAFNGCISLTNIELPNSVTSIKDNVFSGCTLLSTIYYKGTQEQFTKIKIGTNNAPFTDSTVYFYSKTEPTDDGFYWHYDTDGVTPVIWAQKEN